MVSKDANKKVVVVSGYFSPIHKGHVEYFRLAREFAGTDGIVYVIVNSDFQSLLKKNYSFVPEADRIAVVDAIQYVDKAILSIDTDRTVCKTIEMLCESDGYQSPTHFANGGDVTATSPCPEETICNAHNIELVYGLGAKIQSSSWILEASVKVAHEHMFPAKK
jgi:D-beta-D-heptose 7-phosphate kinase/D-beta-D-heptose 1-phosphate adenosyltransferase